MNQRTFKLVLVIGTVFGISFISGCESVPKVVVNFGRDINSHQKLQRVAVLPFTDAVGESRVIWGSIVETIKNNGEVVAGVMAEVLITVPTYQVLERSQFKNILDEQGLSAAEFIEKKGAKETGRLLGADVLVLGTVSKYIWSYGAFPSLHLAFTVRCIRVDTGEIVWSASPSYVASKSNILEYTRVLCQSVAESVKKKIIETSK